jgi:hypothetical protein
MRTLLMLLAVFAILGLAPVMAQEDNAHEELARELTELALEGGRMEMMTSQLSETWTRRLIARAVTDGREMPTEAQRQGLQRAIAQTFREVFTEDVWVEALFPIYMKHFNEDELSTLLHFHQTPVGSKMLRAQGWIAQELQKATQSVLQSRQADFQAALQDKLRPRDQTP